MGFFWKLNEIQKSVAKFIPHLELKNCTFVKFPVTMNPSTKGVSKMAKQIELTVAQMEAMRKLMLEGDPDGIFTFYTKDGREIKPIKI